MKSKNNKEQITLATQLFRANRFSEAENILINISPNAHELFEIKSLLGNIAGVIGDFDGAIRNFEIALKLNPKSIEILYYKGLALQKLERHEDAIHSFELALSKYPDFFEALHGCANSFRQMKRPLDALDCMNKAQVLRPDSCEVYYNRALIFGDLRKYNEENNDYERALQLNPSFVAALVNSAVALSQISKPEIALERVTRALAIDSRNFNAFFVRAEILYELKNFSAALSDYNAALEINPGYTPALSGLATMYAAAKQHHMAVEYFNKLLKIDPDYAYGLGKLIHCNMICNDWEKFEENIEKINLALQARKKCISPFILLGLLDDPQAHRAAAEILVEDFYRPATENFAGSTSYNHKKIRLAYVSADFHEHATSLLMAGLFEHHDKSRFDLIAISYGPDDGSAMRKRIENSFSQFIDVSGKSDREIAVLMRSLEIDIAVDLKGHTTNTRLGIFSYRPAPIQISYLGYPGTTATSYLDYVIADRHVIQEELQHHYTEKIIYLPNSYQVNDSKREIASITYSRFDFGLPENAFVFSSFNNSYKTTPATFDIWMRLLREIPSSVLWLLGTSPIQQENIQNEAIKRGVASERIIFASRLIPAEHLRRLQLSDLYLDNFPYNAHTSASDALWAGVPVLTYQGVAFAGRVASSLLHAIGLPELICTSTKQYESMAIELANSPEKLRELRNRLTLNKNTFPLFDTSRFTKDIERAFEETMKIHTLGLSPKGFSIADIHEK